MLSIKGLKVFYGPICALHGVDLEVGKGEIVAIIGANGAGKTTLLGAIAGIRRRAAGEILFEGSPLPSLAHDVVKRGIALVPEGRRVFGNLTVYENLIMGAYLVHSDHEFGARLREVYELFPRLEERKYQLASTLSGGEQQMLAIARGLMSHPKLLLLDEPSLGLSPLLVKELFAKFKEINKSGTTILLVEQNAKQALMLAHRGYVLQTGRITREGPCKELISDPAVQEAYLGVRRKKTDKEVVEVF